MHEAILGLTVPSDPSMERHGEEFQRTFDEIYRQAYLEQKEFTTLIRQLCERLDQMPREEGRALVAALCVEGGYALSRVRKAVLLVRRAQAGNYDVRNSTIEQLRAVDIARLPDEAKRALLKSAVSIPWTNANLITEAHRKAGPVDSKILKRDELPMPRLTPNVVKGLAMKYHGAVTKFLETGDRSDYLALTNIAAEAERHRLPKRAKV